MPIIEATGEPAACARCGRPAPQGPGEGAAWGSLFVNGRLVQVVCPACLTADERAQVQERDGAELAEVASARRAGADALRRLAETARASDRIAPDDAWLGALDAGGEDVGVLTGAADGPWALAVWSAQPAGGEAAPALLELHMAEWMALEELYVPYGVQVAAARWAQTALGA
jgi:hypothetical protein